jgi:dihydrodipicolinate synthase/N-acetylneuraminate lyase
MKECKPDVVTDHALIRWLERAHNMPMETFRDHLRGIVEEAAKAGARTLTRDGMVYVISETGRLVTVQPDDRRRLLKAGRTVKGRR